MEAMMRSDKTLKGWYSRINQKFFLDELPNNVVVRWAEEDDDHEGAFGWTDFAHDGRHKFEIVMVRDKNVECTVRLATLIHEMIHVATNLRDDHGAAFERWRSILSDRGVFKKGALRTGMTLF